MIVISIIIGATVFEYSDKEVY